MRAIAGWPLGRHRPERLALAGLYRKIAELANHPPHTAVGPPLGEALASVRATLYGLGHDHGPSVEAYRAEAALPNLAPPLALDARAEEWPIARADAVVSINMIHIAPWAACEGLVRGAGRVLAKGGVLYLYGPYRIGGALPAPSNVAFDESLRALLIHVRDIEPIEPQSSLP